jgi:hypothetical protein
MNDVSTDAYLSRTAQAAYPLLYRTSWESSARPLDEFGPFADVIKVLRDVHALCAQLSAKNGKLYDAWTDAQSAWEGLRASDDGTKQYGLLDEAIRKIGWALEEESEIAPQPIAATPATNGAKPKTEYVVADWRPAIISAAELRKQIFAALVWIVDGIIPEGACILAGKPKTKKSWLALAIAVAVAYGGKAFGYYDVVFGRVLYLDLESNQRRMQSRLRAIIGEQAAWPDNFDIATEWKRGDEGVAALDAYCEAHPDTRLIVIDIWAKFRARRDPKADAYEQDYDALQALNAWAERRRVTVIIIHHTRKAKADNIFEEISGTMAITGAVATAMVLARSPDVPDEQILHFEGRDQVEDDPIALKWDAYTCQHIYVATGAEASSSAERRRILEVMEDEEEYQLKDLARLVGKSVKAVDNQLRRLLDDTLITRTGRGRYAKVLKPSGNRGNDGKGRDSGEGGQFSPNNSTSDQGVEMGVEMPLGLSKGLNGSFHAFHDDSYSTADCSIDHVEYKDRVAWRLWHDPSNAIIAEFPTEADAQAAAQRGTLKE